MQGVLTIPHNECEADVTLIIETRRENRSPFQHIVCHLLIFIWNYHIYSTPLCIKVPCQQHAVINLPLQWILNGRQYNKMLHGNLSTYSLVPINAPLNSKAKYCTLLYRSECAHNIHTKKARFTVLMVDLHMVIIFKIKAIF